MCIEMPSSQKMGIPDKHPCSSNHNPLSFVERQRLFSQVAAALVSDMLAGKVEIGVEDIQLDMTNENCSAIFIHERLSRNPDFQKMWVEKSCLSELKKLARETLEEK